MHEIKLDGYRMQLRVEDGEAVMRTRKGLDWTAKFAAVAEPARGLPDCIIDGEVVALDHNGAPDFAALQAALSEGRSQDLIYFVFDLLFEDGEDLRALPLTERKERLKKLLGRKGRACPAHQVRRASLRARRCGAQVGLQSQSRRHHLQARRARPTSPAAPRAGTKAKCRGGHEVVIGGWSGSASNLRSLLVGVYRGDHLVHTGRVGTGFNARNAGGLLKKLNALKTDRKPVRRQGRAAQGQGLDLGQAEAGRRDRVRRLDRRWHGAAGRVQGPARGQAGRRGARRDARAAGEAH